MKSFCIKNNNNEILEYLLNSIKEINMEGISFSKKSFKYYNNLIVHYKGSNSALFVYKMSEIITNCILKFYEKNIVKRKLNSDFCYFDAQEKEAIYNNCLEILNEKDSNDCIIRKEKIFSCLCDYIFSNKFFILDGFVNFRLFEYISLLEEVLETAVNKFIIDKEYKEFISLLQGYIFSQKNKSNIVHIIYSYSDPIILDESENVIPYNNEIISSKYLSDISFSSKDYCLNILLNLLPKQVIVHMLAEEDEFIETLKLIFKNRIIICKECNICKTFSLLNATQNKDRMGFV